MKSECEHDWQPAIDLARGRFRCAKGCGKLGWRMSSGAIQAYKSKPDSYVTASSDWSGYASFYPIGSLGRCPSMDEQERLLLALWAGDDE